MTTNGLANRGKDIDLQYPNPVLSLKINFKKSQETRTYDLNVNT